MKVNFYWYIYVSNNLIESILYSVILTCEFRKFQCQGIIIRSILTEKMELEYSDKLAFISSDYNEKMDLQASELETKLEQRLRDQEDQMEYRQQLELQILKDEMDEEKAGENSSYQLLEVSFHIIS